MAYLCSALDVCVEIPTLYIVDIVMCVHVFSCSVDVNCKNQFFISCDLILCECC